MDNDYYHDGVDKAVLERRNQDINRRWGELYELGNEAEREALKFLFITNSGGAVATLGFIGASELARNSCLAKVSLISFVLGLILVGITRAIILHKLNFVFAEYRKDISRYFSQGCGYASVCSNDENRSKSALPAYCFGYLSVIALVSGCITGGIALFR